MFDWLNKNPTQVVGILSFTLAAIACLFVGRRSKCTNVRAWQFLALINLLYLLEVLVGLRHCLHDLGVELLLNDEGYAKRGFGQQLLILILIGAALSLVVIVFRLYRTAKRSAKGAIFIAVFVFLLFGVETISLHSVDAMIYREIGPVMLVGWIWAIAGFGTVSATLIPRE